MIKSFRDGWLEEFYCSDRNNKKIPADLKQRLFRKLQMLDDAVSEQDLRSPPSNHLEKLKGNLQGKYSIRINDQFRLIFIWQEDTAQILEIYLDNHSYR
jgi:proteic killer suppression protein